MNKETYDYFVAGRWRNRENVLDLVKRIRDKGYKVYCFLDHEYTKPKENETVHEVVDNFEKRSWRDDKSVRDIFERDLTAEKRADNFVMLLPVGKSCHIEAGIAYGLGKKCILIGEQKEAESLYLIFSEVYNDVDKFIKNIVNKESYEN